MFTKSVLYSSLFALAFGKPVARRDHPVTAPFNIFPLVVHDGATFDPSSTTIQQFPSSLSFDGFGGLPSLIGFDSFYGANNFCGVQNILVHQQVVTCQVTPVTVIQQHLAVVAEYAKRVILTQSCETEAQVILFSQWLGNLVGFGQDLRRTTSRPPTYDHNIAGQLPQLVDLSGNINTAGFSWTGSSIGSHAVTVAGGNWNNQFSPATIALTWESCLAAAGPEIPLGVHCSSMVCTAPVVIPQHVPTVTTIVQHTPVHTPVVIEHPQVVTTVVQHTPVWTHIPEPQVHTIVTEHPPVWTPVHVPQPEIITTIVEHAPIHTVVTEHAPPPVHTVVTSQPPVHTTIQTHPAPQPTVVHPIPPVVHTTVIDPHATSTVVEHPTETTLSKGEVSTQTTTTEVPIETQPVDVGVENTGDVEVDGEIGAAGSDVEDINIALPSAETTTDSASVSETPTATDSASVTTTAASETVTDPAAASSTDSVTTTDGSTSDTGSISPFTVPTNSETVPVVARVRRLPPGVARRAWNSRRRV